MSDRTPLEPGRGSRKRSTRSAPVKNRAPMIVNQGAGGAWLKTGGATLGFVLVELAPLPEGGSVELLEKGVRDPVRLPIVNRIIRRPMWEADVGAEVQRAHDPLDLVDIRSARPFERVSDPSLRNEIEFSTGGPDHHRRPHQDEDGEQPNKESNLIHVVVTIG